MFETVKKYYNKWTNEKIQLNEENDDKPYYGGTLNLSPCGVFISGQGHRAEIETELDYFYLESTGDLSVSLVSNAKECQIVLSAQGMNCVIDGNNNRFNVHSKNTPCVFRIGDQTISTRNGNQVSIAPYYSFVKEKDKIYLPIAEPITLSVHKYQFVIDKNKIDE